MHTLSLVALFLTLQLPAIDNDPKPVDDPAAMTQVLAEERARIEVIRKVTPAVVCLFAKDNSAGGGSGVLIDDEGYGLTNFHVVAATLEKREADGGLPDHKKYDVQVLGIDPHGDVAMFLLIYPKNSPSVELGDSDTLQLGDNTLALGNPFLLADDYTPTVTYGIVSGLHRYQWGTGRALSYTDCIQVDTSINPGNSGGPLFDMNGKLLGINGRVSIEERGRVNVGVGYAITINQIKRFIPALRAGLVTPHAAAGFTVIDAGQHIIVNQILPDSAAYRAGLRLNDRILRFGGIDIRSANHFASQLGTFPASWPVELVFQHEAKIIKSRLRLDELPLPDTKKGPHATGRKKADPFGQNPQTEVANHQSVHRAFKLFAKSLGGRDSVAELRSLTLKWVRHLSDQPQTSPKSLDRTESRDAAPADLETAIRWQLFHDAAKPANAEGKVVRSDEVRGRIAVVLERSIESPTAATTLPADATATTQPAKTKYLASFDDADGRLLAIEYTDPTTNHRLRHEYGDERRCGPLRLPHHRWTYEDDKLTLEDEFETITVSGS